jgi:precorrin-2 dehydrogenase/sirohydrochlorin ferrochelatase
LLREILARHPGVLPIMLSSHASRVGIAGGGEALARRRQWLVEAGIEPVAVESKRDIPDVKFLFVAGCERGEAAEMAEAARSIGALVHVEDQPSLCDFYAPALVRRGDLVIAVSTGGRAPGLAKLLRQWLDARFGPEWAGYLDEVGGARAAWRAEGLNSGELAKRTEALVAERDWLG